MVTSFAVIGFGHIGKRHARLLYDMPEARLLAVIDSNPNLREEVALLEGVAFFENITQMYQAGIRPEVISIAVPNGLHASFAVESMQLGAHVVIEKPMALTTVEANEVWQTAKQLDKKAFVVMQNRYSPPSQWLRKVVKEGVLGDIFMVQVQCFWNRDTRYYQEGSWRGTKELDGGVLFTQFSHFIDLLYWVFGDIEAIQAQIENLHHKGITEFGDSGTVNFRCQNGALGNFIFSTATWDKNMESSITVIGSKGTVKIGGQYMNQVEYVHIQDYKMPELVATNPPNNYGGFTGSASNHEYVFENVIKTLAGEQEAHTSLEEGMKVVEIIERIYAAANER